MKKKLFLENGRLYAPYFIFLRCAGEYSDADLLRRFELTAYKRTASVPERGRYALISDDGVWTLLADDRCYTLWTMRTTRPIIAKMAEDHDVYACSVGDCDRSFDFVYYRGGQLVRKYVVEDPDYRGGKVVENLGDALQNEPEALNHDDELESVLSIVDSLGIGMPETPDTIELSFCFC